MTRYDPIRSSQPKSFPYMEPGAFQGFRLVFPFDNLFVDAPVTIERFMTYYNAFEKFISERTSIDLQRGAQRAEESLRTMTEFYVSLIAAVLSRNTSLLSGLAAEDVAETVLNFAEEKKEEKAKDQKSGLLGSSFLQSILGSRSRLETRFELKEKKVEQMEGEDDLKIVHELAKKLKQIIQSEARNVD